MTSQEADSTTIELNVLDLADLRQRCLGNLQLVGNVLGQLGEAVATSCAEIKTAVDQGDAARVRQLAHRLKGTAAHAGAQAMQGAASQLEQLAERQASTDELTAAWQQVGREQRRLADAIQQQQGNPS